MDEVAALATLVGLVAVIPTSATFTSILMGIPGSSSSQATVLDGFPLAKQGQASRALGAAFSASLFGGLFGAIILTFFCTNRSPINFNVWFCGAIYVSYFWFINGRFSFWKKCF